MEDLARQKVMLKGYLEHQKAMPKGPDQASICDELGVRTCCFYHLSAVKNPSGSNSNDIVYLCLCRYSCGVDTAIL